MCSRDWAGYSIDPAAALPHDAVDIAIPGPCLGEFLVVKNGSKIRACTFSVMPVPVSLTEIFTNRAPAMVDGFRRTAVEAHGCSSSREFGRPPAWRRAQLRMRLKHLLHLAAVHHDGPQVLGAVTSDVNSLADHFARFPATSRSSD